MARPTKPADFCLYSLLSDPSLSPDGKRLAFSVRKADIAEDSYGSDVYIADTDGSRVAKFTSGGKDSNPIWSPGGTHIAFTSKRSFPKDEKGAALYVIASAGGESTLLFKSKEGVESPDWSPDSSTVFFLSPVGEEEKDDVRVINRFGFWFNGVGFTYYKRKHLFSVGRGGGQAKQVTKGDLDVSAFAVSHDGRRVAYLAATDDLKPYLSDLFVLDFSSGTSKKLSTSNMELGSLAWSPDDKQIAVVGTDMPRGFSSNTHVWVTGLSQPKLKKVEEVDRSKGNGLNSDARAGAHGPNKILWDGDGIYFVQQDGPSAHLYRTKPGKAPQLVLGGDRSVEGYDVKKGKIAFSAMDASHLEEVFFKEKKDERALTSLNKAVYSELDVVAPRAFSFTASDGQVVEGWVMIPKGAAGRVPTVLYVHGGPKTAFGNSFMHEFQVFVGAGYAVVFMNPRGSDGYSEGFADIRDSYGKRDFQDLTEGLDFAAKTFPQVDAQNAAIAGGSYGGYMSNWAVGHTDRFKAAVADRSIASWISMWGVSDIGPHFTADQIGGDPWKGVEKLMENSPLTYVPNVTTPVMLVHSTEDYRCPSVEGIQFFVALKKMGKEAELVLFPGENHDLSRTGKPKHRVSRLEHYLRWFDSHLARPAPTASA